MKRGFTLIELLAVITILSIIILIASVSLSNVLKDSKEDLSNSQITAIKEAAKSWSSDNMDILPTGNNCSFLTLKDLKDDGLLDEKVIDPKDKKNISNDLKIKIESKMNGTGNSNLTYEVNPDSIKDCLYIGSDMYVDLPQGLTPVIYDGKNWKVPKENDEWYNYDKQMWANAVVLGSGKIKKPGEVVTVEGDNPDALMMLVYIPRYEYKIEGQYGKHSNGTDGTQALPGEIEVKFVNNNQIEADSNYILHPAFNFGGEQLHGIWVGKFEVSHIAKSSSSENYNLECSTTNCLNAEGLRFLPNTNILRNNNVSNFWYGIKSIENTVSFGLTGIDTHMIKNSEWGAVAYLSQSKYGKYGNSDYEGAKKEVYQNKSISYKSGNSNGTPSQSTRYNQCHYNDEKGPNSNQDQKNCGPGASTTGNIYGIYDMSGGAYEFTMGAYGTYKNPTIKSSGFSTTDIFTNSLIDPKYYDVYLNEVSVYNYEGILEPSYGHALSEINGSTTDRGWYGDFTYMVSENKPWFIRGGNAYSENADSGIFVRRTSAGGSSTDCSTRIVCFAN